MRLSWLATQRPANRRALSTAGAVPLLAPLLSSGSTQLRRAAMQALFVTLSDQPQLADTFVAAGGLPPMLRQLTAPGACDKELHQSAFLIASAMSSESDAAVSARHAGVASGCVPRVVAMLGSSDAGLQRPAAMVLTNLCSWGEHAAFSDVVVEAGAVPML